MTVLGWFIAAWILGMVLRRLFGANTRSAPQLAAGGDSEEDSDSKDDSEEENDSEDEDDDRGDDSEAEPAGPSPHEVVLASSQVDAEGASTADLALATPEPHAALSPRAPLAALSPRAPLAQHEPLAARAPLPPLAALPPHR